MLTPNLQGGLRQFFLQRGLIIMVVVFLVAGGISYRSDIGNFFGFGTDLRSSVINDEYYGLVYGFGQQNNLTVTATPDSGNYPKEDLFVSLTVSSAGDIRYGIDEIPDKTNSPLYPGHGINLYDPNSKKSEHVLYAIAIDGNLGVSRLFTYTYRFVPAQVTGLEAIPQSAGRVELIWDKYAGADFKEYRVSVDDTESVSAGSHNAYTFSGLTNGEHSFTVVVVDALGAESEKVSVRSTPLMQDVQKIHTAAEEVSHDLNADGKIDALDVEELLKEIHPSLEVIDAVVRWFKS